MRRVRCVAPVLTSALLLAWLALEPVSAPIARAAFPGQNGLIAFVRSVSGNSEIFTMKADGAQQTNITNKAAVDDMPVWSPDGTKIAFTSNRAGNFELYVMNANGSNVTRLTTSPDSYDWEPSWSADGSKIAFTRDGPGEQAIYTVPAIGGTPTLLLDGAHGPAYSPDGTRLAYGDMEADDESGEIYVLTLATMAKQQITWNTLADADPEWSPDGTMVAVSRFESAGEGLVNMEVWVVEANGFNEAKLVGPEAMYPGWSPDQTKIAYSGYDGANWDIYVTGSSPGGTSTRLTTAPGVDSEPEWQPVVPEPLGTEGLIAFTSTRDGNPEIYVMNPDGTAQTRLTTNTAIDDYPAISPDGSEVAFTSWRDGDAEIFVVDIATKAVTQLTLNSGYDAEPVWNANGALMFVSDRDGTGTDLWFAFGALFGPYGFSGMNNFSPDWGPNGVVMVSDQDGDNELYTFIPDGTVMVPLTSSSQSDYGPDWAPELPGAIFHNVMFVRGAPGEGDLYQISMQQIPVPGDPVPQAYQVTDTPELWEFSPSWRGDTTWVAFARATPGDISSAEIWMMGEEGQVVRVTDTAGANYNPDWGPCTLDADGLCGAVPAPVPTAHARTLTLDLSGHLNANGRLRAPGAAPLCTAAMTVKIQKKVNGDWKANTVTATNADGKYDEALNNRSGKYRAVAPAVTIGADVCARAVSEVVEHTIYL